MKNKILALILAFSIVFTFASAASVQAEAELKEDAAEILISAGIIESALNADTTITRGDFAILVARMYGITDYEGAYQVFSDVSSKDACFDAVKFLSDMGVINGNGGAFDPNREITFNEAIKMCVGAVGKGMVAENKGGYPGGYIAVAEDYDILNFAMTGSAKLTMKYAYDLILSTMEAELTETVAIEIKENNLLQRYDLKPGKNLFEVIYDIEVVEGIVEHNGVSSLYGADELGDGYGIIAGEECFIDAFPITDYLGYNVTAYLQGEDNRVLYLSPKDTEVIKISSRDIGKITTPQTFVYYDGNDEEELKVDKAFDFIYNYKAENFINVAQLMPANGYVTLINNDTDKYYDVISVEEYYNIYVLETDIDKLSVYGENYGRQLILDGSKADADYLVYEDDRQVLFDNIKAGQLLTIAESSDGEFMKIHISSAAVTGQVTSIDDEGRAEISGKLYYIASDCEYEPHLGDYKDFYINVFGEIAYAREAFGEGESYAYIIDAEFDNAAFSDSLLIQMYTTNGFKEVLTAAGKVYLDGNPEENEDNIMAYLCTDDNGKAADSVVNRVVRYKSNAKGEITMIDTVREGKGDYNDTFNVMLSVSSLTHRNDGMFYQQGSESTYYYSGIGIDNDTMIIQIYPGEDGDAEYALGKLSDYIADSSYTIGFYDDNGAGIARVALSYIDMGADGTDTEYIRYSERAMIVDKVSSIIDESSEEECIKVTGLLNGVATTRLFKKSVNSKKGWKAETLQTGDIIRTKVAPSGFVSVFEKIYDHDTGLTETVANNEFAAGSKMFYAWTSSLKSASHNGKSFTGALSVVPSFICGKVAGFENGRVKLDVNGTMYTCNISSLKISTYNEYYKRLENVSHSTVKTIENYGDDAHTMFVMQRQGTALSAFILD